MRQRSRGPVRSLGTLYDLSEESISEVISVRCTISQSISEDAASVV